MTGLDNAEAINYQEKSCGRYICTLCDSGNIFSSSNHGNLEIHVHSAHTVSSILKCVYCTEFVSAASISKHIDMHFNLSNKRPYPCLLCSETYNTMKLLAQHALHFHQMDIKDLFFKCGHCDELVNSPAELKTHLSKSKLVMYHCHFPSCFIKSRDSGSISKHLIDYHGVNSSLMLTSLSFTCSWFSSARPVRGAYRHSNYTTKSFSKQPSSFYCSQCSFGTIHLENFAQHLALCPTLSTTNPVASLSVTCVLHHCSLCGWMTNVRNMLVEHLHDSHPTALEQECIVSEDFTVPISDESLTDAYNIHFENNVGNISNHADISSSNAENSFINSDQLVLHNDLPSICPNLTEFTDSSILSSGIDSHLQSFHATHSDGSCEGDEVGHDNEPSTCMENDNHSKSQPSPAESLNYSKIVACNSSAQENKIGEGHKEIVAEEYVQLYFNEQAFVAAFTKTSKFCSTNKAAQDAELASVLEKLRRFASYRVPILGRANQRRVAGCPECLKPFNHGFTDLKKHLLVTHLGVRRDISRFTIDFTHSSRNSYTAVLQRSLELRAQQPLILPKHPSLGVRNGRLSSKPFRKKPIPIMALQNSLSKHVPLTKYEANDHSSSEAPSAASPDSLSNLIHNPAPTYSGGAPVHRVIPGTGLSDQYDDLRSLEEVASHAPVGRGGIIPLDEMGNPIVAAVLAANQPQSSNYSGLTEIFLPKLGRQRVQLSYSFPVFKRLLEAYQVPTAERIQLVNRMNHYARMFVIMDVLVPGGTQRRFSCPTCMYTSVHSLADIRKHIMGSHCGISTKRFRLCLRASRHDTTTYRLHSDERMIRFVEDHRRRQIQVTNNRTNPTSTSVDSDNEDIKPLANDGELQSFSTESHFNYPDDFHPASTSLNDQEELETQTIEADQCEDERQEGTQWTDVESDNRFLTGTPDQLVGESSLTPKLPDNSSALANEVLGNHNEEGNRCNEEIHRRIELPYSSSVLRILLEREGMLDQYDDLIQKMEAYSKHYLTVVSRGNRIYSYICICGRRFAVVRDEVESDIRPASLADCRRHILGVHARIPQELLTLCCQASRISKESGYKLYADTSLLALAEQHKFRSSRLQTYARRSEINISPSKRPSDIMSTNDTEQIDISTSLLSTNSAAITSGSSPLYSNVSFNHSAPSQIAMRHPASYSTHHPLPPMLRAPSVKREPNDPDSPTYDSNKLNGKIQSFYQDNSNSTKSDDLMRPTTKVEFTLYASSEGRPSGLDLDAPRHVLSPEESVRWSEKLSLPKNWSLERIVRLVYSPSVFEQQVRSILPDGNDFITSLHERMRVYSRHSVYITRLRDNPNQTQRIYVCCACLTTSQHGFGDVRKHILGVHAHVPERFKAAAMSSSRLNRDDYTLYPEHQLIQLANSSGRGSNLFPNALRAFRRRQRAHEHSTIPLMDADSPSRKKYCPFSDIEPVIKRESFEQSMSIDDGLLNGHHSFSAKIPDRIRDQRDEHRPPIILTLPRPKAFHPSDQPDDMSFQSSPSDFEKPVDDYIHTDTSCSTGSRSRRSMILKSKRPCPTSS